MRYRVANHGRVGKFLEEGRRPPRDVVFTKRAYHGLPASDAFPLAHMQRITDGLGDFEFVIWIHDKCARELLGSTCKLRKDQDPRI